MARRIEEPRASGVFNAKQKSSVAKDAFQREAKLILDGWVDRRRRNNKGEISETEERPADWMLRCTYRLVRSLIAKRHEGVLPDLADDIPGHSKGKTDISEKPFKLALLVMFHWNPELTSEPLLTRQRRSELSDAMEYARRHKIQPRNLIGFIKAAGIKRIPSKLRNEQWEPGFETAQKAWRA